ncbi:DUF4139 domain-containing protein [Brevundimonas sp.]|uniref:DUF4139 domain-containing protein n=2 Tax=Brevundimonas sp. TaxID=1871086 RepID=UPI002FC9556A
MRPLYAALAAAAAWAPLVAVAAPGAAAQQAPLRAEAVSNAPEKVEVVVYRDQPVDTVELMERSRQSWSRLDREGLALIVETRTVDVPAGEGVIRFKGLATGIVPHSAVIEGLSADLIEQNADYDLITPTNLLERTVGQTVSVVRTNATSGAEETVPAVIRAGENGVVLEVGGQFEALDCSGLTERIVFNQVPEGLGATPTLSVRTRAAQAGRHTITLAYLATGLQWSADYVARLKDDGQTLDLQGWVTLANFGGTSFANAPVTVVAGDLSMTGDSVPVQLRARYNSHQCWPMMRTSDLPAIAYPGPPPPPPPPPAPAAPMMSMRAEVADIVVTGNRIKAKMEELGDYKAYVLPEPTTVAANQTKQVLFLEQEGVTFRRAYVVDMQAAEPQEAPSAARIELVMRNDEASGLGLPVPGGKAMVMQAAVQADSGFGPMLGGEARFSDTPQGLPLRLVYGDAAQVTSQVLLQETRPRGSGGRQRQQQTHQVKLVNGTDGPVQMEVLLPAYVAQQTGFRIEREGIRSRIDPDRGVRVWMLELPAGTERTFDVRWSYSDPA